MIFNFIISIVVSRLTAAPPQEVQELTENIRFPRGDGSAKEIQIH